jgi:hypothetical protein
MLSLRFVQLQGSRQGLHNRVRDPRQVPALEPGVIVETHPGQRGDLLPPQARHPPLFAVGRHSSLLWGDPGPAADKEVVYGLTVHTPTLRAGRRPEEGTASTRLSRPCHSSVRRWWQASAGASREEPAP